MIQIPFLHLGVVDSSRGLALPATWSFPWLSGAATAILLAAFLSAVFGGLGARETARLLGSTTRRLLPTIGAVSAFLAFASIATYSGMMSALGRALAASGGAFPLLSPAIGWIGVLMTGSDTASNAVFGRLQVTTAAEVGMPAALAAAANTVGGTAGKMVSPQSIAVACAACGLSGREGELLKRAMPLSLGLCGLVALLTLATAHLAPGLVPSPGLAAVRQAAGPAVGAGPARSLARPGGARGSARPAMRASRSFRVDSEGGRRMKSASEILDAVARVLLADIPTPLQEASPAGEASSACSGSSSSGMTPPASRWEGTRRGNSSTTSPRSSRRGATSSSPSAERNRTTPS